MIYSRPPYTLRSSWLKGIHSLPFKPSGAPFPIHSISTDQAPLCFFLLQHWEWQRGGRIQTGFFQR